MIIFYVQEWEESESGWGCQSDGYSIHARREDVVAFIKAYWASMPDEPPSTYSRPLDYPRPAEIGYDHELYPEIERMREKQINGVRIFKHHHLFDLVDLLPFYRHWRTDQYAEKYGLSKGRV